MYKRAIRGRQNGNGYNLTERAGGLTMTAEDTQIVRVRVNISGIRLIGFVSLPPSGEFSRFSDALNSAEPYILIRDQEGSPEPGESPSRAVLKDSITYVEALVEPGFQRRSPQGTFEAVAVSFKKPVVTLSGELFVPQHLTALDVFNDGRRFINLRNVEFRDSAEAYDFLAVGKAQTYLIELS